MSKNPLYHKMDLAARFAEGYKVDYLALFLRHQLEVLERIDAGEDYLAATYYVPGELLASFDVPVLFLERTSGFAAANGLIDNPGLKARQYRMPSCGCSYQMLMECLFNENILPPPKGFIAASYSCDDAWMYCRMASLRYGVPFYLVDIAHGAREAASVNYLENQLSGIYDALASQYPTARTRDEVVRASNEAIGLKHDIDALRTGYPGILESAEGFKIFTLYNDLGRDYALKVLDSLYQTLRKRTPDYSLPDGPRLIWLGVIPLYHNNLIKEIEKKYSCRIMYEELFEFGEDYITEEDFFRGLSRRIVNSIFFSPEQRLNAILGYIGSMRIDGIIHFSQNNCRFLPPGFSLLQRKLAEHGIPTVDIGGDVVYRDGFDAARCWDRMDVLFEQVRHRRNN